MRVDLDVIREWIAPRARVLDLGCGGGDLLHELMRDKQIEGYGLEIDPQNIATCIDRGSTSSSRISIAGWEISAPIPLIPWS